MIGAVVGWLLLVEVRLVRRASGVVAVLSEWTEAVSDLDWGSAGARGCSEPAELPYPLPLLGVVLGAAGAVEQGGGLVIGHPLLAVEES
eukprot:5981518-Pyramimonas_sp.AAC.1